MIEFDNKGKIISIEYDEEQECHVFKLAKKLVLQPKEKFVIETGVAISCTHHEDECVISELVSDDIEMYFVSDRYNSDFLTDNIELIGFYNGEEPLELKKGDIIAQAICYHRCIERDEFYLPPSETNNPIMYMDDNMRIQALNGSNFGVEQVAEPDGSRYIKIPLGKGTENNG